MIMKTKYKNLKELNQALKAEKAGYKVIFSGYMPTGRVGSSGEKTRHYIDELTAGENVGCTRGDFYEIGFDAADDDFFLQ